MNYEQTIQRLNELKEETGKPNWQFQGAKALPKVLFSRANKIIRDCQVFGDQEFPEIEADGHEPELILKWEKFKLSITKGNLIYTYTSKKVCGLHSIKGFSPIIPNFLFDL